MSKKMLIDATHAEETRVVVVDGQKVEEFDFESETRRQLSGNIYLAKVTRVEPSLQAAFIDYGGNRHGFLAFSEIHPDYYQIPVADREALLAEEAEIARAEAEEEDKPKPKRGRGRGRPKAAKAEQADAVVTEEVTDAASDDAQQVSDAPAEATEGQTASDVEADARTVEIAREIPGMDVVDLTPDAADVAEIRADDAAAEDDGTEAPDDDDEEYVAAKTASEKDATVEDVADEDVTEEIRPKRRQRARRYKIQEVIKVRQILLVQVVKEERGNKGAALTTYLSLAGRYCVLMPNTARGGGISRKITQAADRKKLKEIAGEIDVPQGAGLIIRTAGAKRTKTEIKRDYEYLQRMWEEIRNLTLKSIAPAKIYEEGNLIKRSIRDLYSREIDEVLVEGEAGYRTAKDFMKMIMPSHAKNVKHYGDGQPLFARYQVESYLGAMFNPTVQLKSGGYIVIGITEALVAIDVNSGKATKRGSIEETATETNLEAAEEIARQLRLRDLAGLIVIDFIDMEDRKNNAAVEKRFKDRLKNDRARIQVGRISAFGLMEMSRQRLRPGMLEASTQPCPSCHGTGLIRSEDSMGLTIIRQIEEEGTRRRSREVLVKAPVQIANFLMNMKREHIAQIESRYGMSVRIEGDPHLVAPDFTVEKFKTATRVVEAQAPVVSADATLMADIDDDVAEEGVDEEGVQEDAPRADDDQPKKKRRRRRRRGRGRGGEDQRADEANGSEAETQQADAADGESDAKPDAPEAEAEEKPARRRSRGGRGRRKKTDDAVADDVNADADQTSDTNAASVADETSEDAPAAEGDAEADKPKKRRTRSRRKAVTEAQVSETVDPGSAEPAAEMPEQAPEPEQPPVEEIPTPTEMVQEPAAPEQKPQPEPVLEDVAPAEDPKPRRKGWWSMGR